MRLPFQKKKGSGTKYSLIDPDISDSDESAEESILFQKKFGHVELNLVPRPVRIRTAKNTSRLKNAYLCLAVTLITGSVITLALFLGSHFFVGHSHTRESPPDWNKTYTHHGGEGALRLFDVDGDGIDDIIFAAVDTNRLNDVMDVVGNKFDDLHRYCKLKELDYPCVGSMIALRGTDGQELWRFNTRSESFLTICNVDLNGDGLLDCIATGRQSNCVAFDPRKGEVLWMAEDDRFLASTWNIYQALALEDWDNDGIKDILIVNGGDPIRDAEDHNREAGRAIMLSGATGRPLGDRYLAMPESRESYMSPALYNQTDGSAPYVLLGSGGETIPGDLLAITTTDLCRYIMRSNTSNCPHYEGRPIWDQQVKDHIGLIKIYQGKTKGVMVAPVIVDVTKDGVSDLVVSAYEGAVILIDGKSLDTVWTANFTGLESYSSPAPGYFDDDDTLDFMVHWCIGAWDKYTGSNTSIVSGKDGSIIWNLGSAYMQMTSDLALKTNDNSQDMFVYRVQGQGSKFTWNKEGKVVRADETRQKRHGDSFKRPVGENKIQDLLDANYTWNAAVFDMYEQYHLTCLDDLETFKGEVFLMDRTNSHNPLRILEMDAVKYSYDIPDKDPDEEKIKILQKLYPDRLKDDQGLPSDGFKTHLTGTFIPDNSEHSPVMGGNDDDDRDNDDDDDMGDDADNLGNDEDGDDGNDGDKNGDDVHGEDVDNHHDDLINDDIDHDHSNMNSNDGHGDWTEDGSNDNGNDVDANNDANDGSSDSNISKDGNHPPSQGGVEDEDVSGSPRRKRHLDDVNVSDKLCTVAFYDARTTGAIGDVDGDGLLDYVSVLSLMKPLVDKDYSYSSMDYDIVINKVSFEKRAREGSLTPVPVMADTDLKDAPSGNQFDKEDRIFRPITEQMWTAFMGKEGKSQS